MYLYNRLQSHLIPELSLIVLEYYAGTIMVINDTTEVNIVDRLCRDRQSLDQRFQRSRGFTLDPGIYTITAYYPVFLEDQKVVMGDDRDTENIEEKPDLEGITYHSLQFVEALTLESARPEAMDSPWLRCGDDEEGEIEIKTRGGSNLMRISRIEQYRIQRTADAVIIETKNDTRHEGVREIAYQSLIQYVKETTKLAVRNLFDSEDYKDMKVDYSEDYILRLGGLRWGDVSMLFDLTSATRGLRNLDDSTSVIISSYLDKSPTWSYVKIRREGKRFWHRMEWEYLSPIMCRFVELSWEFYQVMDGEMRDYLEARGELWG